jgi:ribonucleotide monophosphatase NagD (HAD superfamily)
LSEIFSSAYSAASYIEKMALPEGKRVYVVGMSGIQDELDLKGIKWVGGEVIYTLLCIRMTVISCLRIRVTLKKSNQTNRLLPCS